MFWVVPILMGLVACEKKEYQSIEELDEENIQQYIRQNNLSVQQYGTTGMYYEVLQEGDPEKLLKFDALVPMVFTVKSLDGTYVSSDTLQGSNRYYDFLGYYPYGNSSSANLPSSPVEANNSIKNVLAEMLKYENGRIRIIIPSRYLYGRNGNSSLGIPANASLDYVFHVLSASTLPAYEDFQIRNAIANAGASADEYEKTETGIYYKILELGDGDGLTIDSLVTASYVGKFLSGAEFDSSDSAVFRLSGVITSWGEIIPKVNRGGKIEFYTPSTSAYGRNGSGSIPQFTPLYFSVTIRNDD